MAAGALGRDLFMSGRAAGHDRRARLKLSALVHYSIDERADCSPGQQRAILRRILSAPRPRPIASLTP